MPDDHLLAVQERTLRTIERAISALSHPSMSDVHDMELAEALTNLQWCEERTEEIDRWHAAVTMRRNALVRRVVALTTNVESLHDRRRQRRPVGTQQEGTRRRPRRVSQERG